MADPRFFRRSGPFALAELASSIGARLVGGEPEATIRDVAPLDRAAPDEVSFFDHQRYADQAAVTRAAACIVKESLAGALPEGTARLLTDDPQQSYARVAAAFYPDFGPPGPGRPPPPATTAGAWIHPDARVADDCRVGPGAVIEAGAEIGPRTRIEAGAIVGPGVLIGADCVIGPGASITFSRIGDRCLIHAGARLGQDGFGFAMGAEGHLKVPQLGCVIVEDEVEIGANTTIDRGSGPDTVIGRGCKIDNLVMIAHNVDLGPGCVIVAQSGISGSTRFGAGCVVAAQAGVTGHLTIGPGAQFAARSAIIRDMPGGMIYGGAPAIPVRDWRRQMAAISRLGKRKDEGR